MQKQKFSDETLWRRFGIELYILERLISDIHCDPDYCDVMLTGEWDKMFRIQDMVNILRVQAEERMDKKAKIYDRNIFYPWNPKLLINELNEIRNRCKDLAENPDQNNI